MDQPQIVAAQQRVVALVGTPNSGKTSLFNALSGLNQKVGNFSGVTVERKTASLSSSLGGPAINLIDLPGTNSLYPSSGDEQVTFDVLYQRQHPDYPDLVVVVVDATQMRRGLMLATQVMDLGFPVVVAFTMMDLADQQGLLIDFSHLSELLGVPVVGLSVQRKRGLEDLRQVMQGALHPPTKPVMAIPLGFRPMIDLLREALPTDNDYQAYQALVSPQHFLTLDPALSHRLREQGNINEQTAQQLISNELLIRLDRADELSNEVINDPPTLGEQLTERLDTILTHPIGGYLIFIGILLMVFQAVFAWATYPMDLIEGAFDLCNGWLKASLPPGWFTNLLTDGLITGLGGIVIFVPQIAFLFFFITLLEESGYMARVVFLMDRIMRPFGFSGRSVTPLIGGMACAIPSIMMSRGIPDRKERLITILVTPLMSCSARIPVYTLLIALFIPAGTIMGIDQRGLLMTVIYLLGFVLALLMAWIFKMAFGHRAGGMFLMELPAYRAPRWRNVGLTVYQKSSAFVMEAGRVILIISLLLWALVAYGPGHKMEAIEAKYAKLAEEDLSPAQVEALAEDRASEELNASYAASLGKFIEPAIAPLGYDWKIGISLITSFAAREVFVGTMSVIYQQQDTDATLAGDRPRVPLIERLRRERDPATGKPIYTAATVLSLIVFYAIAMQCMSTLAVTRKEVGWTWAAVMLGYLMALAYLASFLTYQLMA
jgi:ferrous iron transport protein B